MGIFDSFKKWLQKGNLSAPDLPIKESIEQIVTDSAIDDNRQATKAIGNAYAARDEEAKEYIYAEVEKGMATSYEIPNSTTLLKKLHEVSMTVQLMKSNGKNVDEYDYQAFVRAGSVSTMSQNEIRRIQERAPKMGLVPPAYVLANLLAEAYRLGGNAVIHVRCEIKRTEKAWGDSRWNSAVELSEEAVITGLAAIVKETKKADTF